MPKTTREVAELPRLEALDPFNEAPRNPADHADGDQAKVIFNSSI